jgi:hypothetical protein
MTATACCFGCWAIYRAILILLRQFDEGRNAIGAAMPVGVDDDQPGAAEFNTRNGSRSLVPPIPDLASIRACRVLPAFNGWLLIPALGFVVERDHGWKDRNSGVR